MAKVLLPKDVSNPQHLQFRFVDSVDGIRRRMTIYTGLLRVEHFTGHTRAPLEIQFPLVGLFGFPPGTVGILPFHNPLQFQAAVATASIANFVDKTDVCIASILSVQADLRGIVLKSPHITPLLAVVLAATVQGQNSEVKSIGYQVTVLEKILPNVPQQLTPILVGAMWNGEYEVSSGSVGAIEQPGVPQQ